MTHDTTAISAPVEAIDEEIDRLKDRLDELARLRDQAALMIEEVELALNGSAPATKPPPAAPRTRSAGERKAKVIARAKKRGARAKAPDPPSGRTQKASPPSGRSAGKSAPDKSPEAARLRAEELHELLKRQSPMTEREIQRTTGWLAGKVRTALTRLADDGRARPTGEARSAPHGGRASPEWTLEADASPEPPAPASTTDDAGANPTLEPDPLVSEDASQRSLSSSEPSPPMDPQAARTTSSVGDRVMFHLDDEILTVEQLAGRVVLHPRIVAEALSTLKAQGKVEKVAGGCYQLVEENDG